MKSSIYDACSISVGGTPSTKEEQYWNGIIPWLSVNDFKGEEKFVYDSEKSITKLGLENSATKILNKNDIIISARGTVGELAMLPYDMAYNQSCYGLKAIEEIITPDFLYYSLKNCINALKQKSYGSVFDTITIDTFKDTIIDIPSINIQKKLTLLLSKMDNKIGNNNRINDNLPYQSLMVA